MVIAETIILLLACHLIGDYVLQSAFIAETKGKNWYHLFVHCFLYSVPFFICFGLTWHLSIIFVAHMIIDTLKARYDKINYWQDQVLHYMTCLLYFI